MAVYRQIHISFWQDPFILTLTPEEKYFYLYLMTNSKTSQCGVYEIPKQIMVFETGYNTETIDKLLQKFIGYNKIEYSEETKEILIKNWLKYNSFRSPKVMCCIKEELSKIKHQPFKRKTMDSLSIDSGEEKEKEKEEEEEAPPLDITQTEILTLNELKKIKGYKFNYSIELEFIRKLAIDYPNLNVLNQIRSWCARKLDEPLKNKSKPHGQIANWFAKAEEWRRERQNRSQLQNDQLHKQSIAAQSLERWVNDE